MTFFLSAHTLGFREDRDINDSIKCLGLFGVTYLVGIMARISGTLGGNNSELEKGQTKRKLNKKEVMRSMSLPKVHSELLGVTERSEVM